MTTTPTPATARILLARAPRPNDDHPDCWVVLTSGDPSTPAFARVEVPLHIGITKPGEAIVEHPRHTGPSRSPSLERDALALVAWLANGGVFRVSTNREVSHPIPGLAACA